MSCPNCHSDNVLLFHDKVWSSADSRVFKCNDCSLIFIDPMMSEEEERAFYANYNEHVKARGVITTQSVDEFHQKSLPMAQERLSVVEAFFQPGAQVLEVGSSTGAFLSVIPQCETYACELADDNREYSSQFATGGVFESLESVENQSFDVICMFHVFEHIRRSHKFLDQCLKHLKPEGRVLIEVPCSEDPLITIFNMSEYKDFIFQPMHPMVYNEASLDYVFNKAGMTKEKVIYHQRYGLDNHLAWLKNRQPGGDENLQALFGDINGYRQRLQALKKTDTIFYVAKKAS